MNAIVLLFVTGLIFLAFEIVMPGAVLGILGGVALLGGCALAFVQFGVTGGLSATGVAVALIGLMLYLEYVVLPKTRWGKRMFLRTSIAGTSQPELGSLEELSGKSAEALTTLAPSGYVSIGGKRYEAFSQSGHIEKGTALRVVSVDNFRIIVTKNQTS